MSLEPVAPRLSAAIMLVRPDTSDDGIEVFMVRRHARSDFAPGVYVFPGGAVEESDRAAEVAAGVCAPFEALDPDTALGSGVRAAAVRELFEEAGVLLALNDGTPIVLDAAGTTRLAGYREQLQRGETTIGEVAAILDIVLATNLLTHCAHWITPEAYPKRFNTHFFLTPHPTAQEAEHDARETTSGVWVRPAEALAAYERGDFPLVFATVRQLRDLASQPTPAAAIDAWRARVPPLIMPRSVARDGREIILMPGEPGPVE